MSSLPEREPPQPADTRPVLGVVVSPSELAGPSPATAWHRWADGHRAPKVQEATLPWIHTWPEDLTMLAQLGGSEIAITLEWAELEPTQGRYLVDTIDRYRQMLEKANALGLEVWACLVDNTLPGWFEVDERGFRDPKTRGLLWPRHVEWVGETFGDLVAGWVPQRSPVFRALRGNLWAVAPPGRNDPARASEEVRDTILGSYEAWRILSGGGPVAAMETFRSWHPITDNVKAERHARQLHNLTFESWMRAITEGVVQAGDVPEVAVAPYQGAYDRLIIELAPPAQVAGDGAITALSGSALFEPFADNLEAVFTHADDRPILAAGSLLAPNSHDRMGAAHVDDTFAFITELTRSTPLVGWWQTSPIDGYHWENGHATPGVFTAQRQATEAANRFQHYSQR